MKTAAQWFLAALAVIIMLKMAYAGGKHDAQLGYWDGWQDAMLQTEYGTKPFNSETNLK